MRRPSVLLGAAGALALAACSPSELAFELRVEGPVSRPPARAGHDWRGALVLAAPGSRVVEEEANLDWRDGEVRLLWPACPPEALPAVACWQPRAGDPFRASLRWTHVNGDTLNAQCWPPPPAGWRAIPPTGLVRWTATCAAP